MRRLPSQSSDRQGKNVRSYVIAIGCEHYSNEEIYRRVPSARQDAEEVANCFQQLGFEHVLPELTDSPKQNSANAALQNWFQDDARSDTDRVLFYFSGHGELDKENRQYLQFRDARRPPNWAGSMAADYLADIVAASAVTEFLIVIDACFSGDAISNMLAVFARKISHRWLGKNAYGYGLISASRPQERAMDRVFAKAFVETLTHPPASLGAVTRYIKLEELDGHLQAKMASAPHKPVLTPWGNCRVIPNPLFDPGKQAASYLGVKADMRYFEGRETALKRIEDWLSAVPSQRRVCVVTGSAGSGKSMLLAKVASVERLREFDLVMSARGQTAESVAREISAALQFPAQDPKQLLTRLSESGRAVRLLLDSLDEALDSERIAQQLVIPLSAFATSRVLIGKRRESPVHSGQRAISTLGDDVLEIDLDDRNENPVDAEIVSYARSRLMAVHEREVNTPYRDAPENANKLAQLIAEGADGLFLLADLWTDDLRGKIYAVDTSEAGWEQHLKLDPDRAFQSRFEGFGTRRKIIADILMPLAFTEGSGLPWNQLWSAAASGISGVRYEYSDIESVRKEAAAFIVEAEENGVPVVRLYHEKLSEMLKGAVSVGKVQQKLFDVMMRSVPVEPNTGMRLWRQAHSHVQTHLVAYAARAGQLEAVLKDEMFLLMAEPSRVRVFAKQTVSPEAARIRDVYLRADLTGRDAGERAAALELAALRAGDVELARRFGSSELDKPWRALWLRVHRPESQYRVLTAPMGRVVQMIVLPEPPFRLALVRVEDERSVLEIWNEDGGLWGKADCGEHLLALGAVVYKGQSTVAVIHYEALESDTFKTPDWGLSLSLWTVQGSVRLLERFDLGLTAESWDAPHSGMAHSFLPDELTVYFGYALRSMAVRVDLLKQKANVLRNFPAAARGCAFTENKEHASIIRAGSGVEIFDLVKRKPRWSAKSPSSFLPAEIEEEATAVALPSLESGPLLLGDDAGTISVLDGPPWRVRCRLVGRGGTIRQLALAEGASGQEIVSLDDSGNIKVWTLPHKVSASARVEPQRVYFSLDQAERRLFLHERTSDFHDSFWLLNEEGAAYDGADLEFLRATFSDMGHGRNPVAFANDGVYQLEQTLSLSGPDGTSVRTLRGRHIPLSVQCKSSSYKSLSVVDGYISVIERTSGTLRLFQCHHQWTVKNIYSGKKSDGNLTPWFLLAYFSSQDSESASPWVQQIIRMASQTKTAKAEKDAGEGKTHIPAAHTLRMAVDGDSLLMAGAAGSRIVLWRARLGVDEWESLSEIDTNEPIEELDFVGLDKIAVMNEAGCVLFWFSRTSL